MPGPSQIRILTRILTRDEGSPPGPSSLEPRLPQAVGGVGGLLAPCDRRSESERKRVFSCEKVRTPPAVSWPPAAAGPSPSPSQSESARAGRARRFGRFDSKMQ